MNDVVKKAWRVVYSCQTPAHYRCALRYLHLLSQMHPTVDVTPLRTELDTLFHG